jgi:energy-coupling factor transporter transmembrane protein EcfT
VSDVNISSIQSISQAYAYPTSSGTSFDDLLMQNTFSLTATPRRCLLISPFFWALITLCVAFVILIIMGVLYYSPSGMKYFHRLECIFRHSDLIGNGELWFGGLISLAILVLIIYCFWFGSVFLVEYPIETAGDAYFACDTSLRNTQLDSSLRLLATIKSNAEAPMFDILDKQNFTMTVNFVQAGYGCDGVTAQVNT